MRIAHFSDTHLLSLRGVSPLAFVGKRITGGVNLLLRRGQEYSADVLRRLIDDANAQKPDHVVVTGDVSNLSLRPEFELVRAVLAGLSLPACEVTLIPGNHDCYTLGEARRDNFGKVLSAHLEGDISLPGQRFPFVRLRDEVAIVALSSARPMPPLIARGTLGQAQLAQAGEMLEATEERFRIVLVHHPLRSPHVEWHAKLNDSRAALELIAQRGADLVLHGHLHRNLREELEGPGGTTVPQIGVTSGSWLSPRDPARRAAYNIYEIEGRGLKSITTRRYDLERERFS